MSRAFPAVYEDTDLFALHIPERNAIEVLLSSRRKKLLADDKTVAGLQ